jgi:hypothetical protein
MLVRARSLSMTKPRRMSLMQSPRLSVIKARRARAAVLIEAMEQRMLMSAVAFQVDPMRSSITLSGNAAGFNLKQQGVGSLTTSYSGTINADASGGAITLTGGSNVVAADSGAWQPGNAPANYGASFDAGLLGHGVAAARDLAFDATSPAEPVGTDGSFDAANAIVTAISGSVDYDATLLGKPYTGSSPATGQSAQNQAPSGTYTVANGVATMIIPVQITLNFSLVTPDDTHAIFTGDLVATANVQANAKLLSTAFSDGSTSSNQVQRSEVREIAFTFDKPLTPGAGSLSLSLLNTGGSGLNNASAATDASSALGTPTSSDGGRTWIVPIRKSTSFSDSTGSLDDGIYSVAVNPSNVTGATLTGANVSTTFHRLYGDIDGNGIVNSADYFKFKAAFGSSTGQANFNADFDVDGNGKINSSDYFKFKANFGRKFTY